MSAVSGLAPRPAVDLRLALPAATTWLAAAVVCGWRPHRSVQLVLATTVVLVGAFRVRRFAWAAAAGGVALGASSAALHAFLIQSGPVADLARTHGRGDLTLTLVRDPAPRVARSGRPFTLADATVTAVGDKPARAPALVIAHGSGWLGLLPGQRLRVRARLAPPRSADGLAAVVLPAGPPTLVGGPPWWQRAAGAMRARLRVACRRLPADERGLVPGLVVGDVSQMPQSLTDAFRASGLTHLNAVSGENCAIVLATVFGALRRTPLGRGSRLVAAALALVGFVVLARPSPSVLRAATMGAAALAAMSLGRRPQPLPLLSAAVLVLVLTDPFIARAPGFALSVLATAAIVLLAPRWTESLSLRLPRPVAVAIAVPAAAQLACTPVLVLVFRQATPWAVPANLLAAPAVAPATVVGIGVACVALVAAPVATLLAWLAAVPAGWLAWVARSIAALPGANARWPAGVGGAALLTVLIGAVGVALLRRRTTALHAMLGAWPP